MGLREIYYPGIISIKPKGRVETDKGAGNKSECQKTTITLTPSDIVATAMPKWAPVKWSKAGEEAHETNDADDPAPVTGIHI